MNSKVIINNIKNDINDTQSIISNSNINVSKDKKELENLINELNEKKENFFIKKNAELFVLHELVNILDERIKEDNLKFNKRNINNEKEFRNNTNKLVITLNEQNDKIKILENNLKNLKKDLNIE